MATSEQQAKVQWYLNNGGLTDDERAVISTPFNAGNATPDQLISRYGTVSGAQGKEDYQNLVKGLYGNQDQLYQYAYDTYNGTFGRGPTASEFAQLLPVFGGTEGRQRGAAYVSQLYDQYKQSPEYIRGQAGGRVDDVQKLFEETYGRQATADEAAHFGTQLAGGRDAYDLGNELKLSPEYQAEQDKTFRTGLASELEGYDTSFFNKQKQGVYADYARRGFAPGNSPSLDYALTNVMGEIADKRGAYLANISSQQYGGNKEAARADYLTGRDRYFADQDYDRNLKQRELDYYRSRGDQDRDYMTQRDDYYNQMSRSKQGQGTLHSGDWLNIGLGAANTAARFYGAGAAGGAGGGGGGYPGPYSYGYLNQ